jgi:ABC-type transport system involved in cytochrome c biogenesis permease subunit
MALPIPSPLPLPISFLHPLLMWVLLGLSIQAMVLGIKAKKTRTAPAEERKTLVKGQFARRHFRSGSLVLALMTLGTVGGLAVTYVNNGKLFVGPHLLVALAMLSMIAIAASLTPLMQAGNEWARKIHVGMNMLLMTLFLWQAVTGMQIVNKLLQPQA